MDVNDIKKTVKDFLLREFLPGENPDELTDDVALITGGILDSIATLKLVTFLEEQYKIELAPHETDAEHMDNLSRIAELVQSKLAA
jgi:acyl carrier protein